MENNYTFSIPEECRQAIETYKTENSSVRTFIEECCEPLDKNNPKKTQTASKFWNVFKRWCDDGKFYVPSKGEFRKELSQATGLRIERLVEHTREGDFYPFVVKEEFIREYLPWELPALS